LLILNQVTNLISYPLAPIVVLFASKEGWLPKWLWWFQTPDNPVDGDRDWKNLYRPFKKENTRFKNGGIVFIGCGETNYMGFLGRY